MKNLKLTGLTMATLLTFAISLFAEEPVASGKPVSAEKPAAVKPLKKKKVIKAAPASSSKPVTVQQAEPAQKGSANSSVMAWLKDLRKRVTKSQARQSQIVAVAAVRGNETPDSPPLYWKGKKSAGNVEMPELKEFEAALDAAIAGDTAASKEKLKMLVSTYPQSPLADEAQETLKKLETDTPAHE